MLPGMLVDLWESLRGARCTAADKPIPWLASLMRAGKQSELLKIEASVRAKLGVAVEAQLRCCQIVADCAAMAGTFAADWSDTKALNSGMMAVTDICNVASELMGDLPGYEQARDKLLKKSNSSVDALISDVRTTRVALQPTWADVTAVSKSMAEMVQSGTLEMPADVQDIVRKYNREGETLLQDAMDNMKVLRAKDELMSNVLWWREDLKKTTGDGKLAMLQALVDDGPSGEDVARGIHDLMVAELCGRDMTDAALMAKEVKALAGFASAALQFTKKDTSVHAQSLLDARLKACGRGQGSGSVSTLSDLYHLLFGAFSRAAVPRPRRIQNTSLTVL